MSTALAPYLDAPLSAIVQLCQDCGVRSLEAFPMDGQSGDGSAADWSFAVVFDDADPRRIAPRWVRLEDGLEQLMGRPVEVIGPTALENPYLRRDIERHGQRIFPPAP